LSQSFFIYFILFLALFHLLTSIPPFFLFSLKKHRGIAGCEFIPIPGYPRLERNHILVHPDTPARLDPRVPGPIPPSRPVRFSSLEPTRSHANRSKETPGTQSVRLQDQKIRCFATEDHQELHSCGRGTGGCRGGKANRKDNFKDPAGDTKDYPPPSLYPAPTTATPSAALEHGIQQYQMLGYDQFFLHDIDPAILGSSYQNRGDDTSGGGLRTERRTKRRTPAHRQLGLCILRSLRPKGAYFLREAGDGTRGGRAYGGDYDPCGIVWQNGNKNCNHDGHYDHRDHRDTAPGRARVRRVSGAAKTPAESDSRRKRKAATQVSSESPMGQRRPYTTRELSLQAPPIRTTRARKCVNIARIFQFFPCSISCFFPCFWSSSMFSHSSNSWLFGFRGDLGFSKCDIRRCRRRKRRVIRSLSEFADLDLPRVTVLLAWMLPPMDPDDTHRPKLGISRMEPIWLYSIFRVPRGPNGGGLLGPLGPMPGTLPPRTRRLLCL